MSQKIEKTGVCNKSFLHKKASANKELEEAWEIIYRGWRRLVSDGRCG